jgi:hypothetical protein
MAWRVSVTHWSKEQSRQAVEIRLARTQTAGEGCEQLRFWRVKLNLASTPAATPPLATPKVSFLYSESQYALDVEEPTPDSNLVLSGPERTTQPVGVLAPLRLEMSAEFVLAGEESSAIDPCASLKRSSATSSGRVVVLVRQIGIKMRLPLKNAWRFLHV